MRVFHHLSRRAETNNLYHLSVGIRRTLLVVAVLILPLVWLTAQETDRDAALNRALASDLVDEATRLQRVGDVETAREIARRALAVDPEYGAARLRVASFLAMDQDATIRHVSLLENALDGDLSREDRSEAVNLLARAYLRTGRTEQARSILEEEILRGSSDNLVIAWRRPDPIGTTTRALTDAEILFLRAVIGSAPRWRASAFLRETRRRFPEDPRVAMVDWLRHERLSLEALEWVDAAPPEQTNGAYVDIVRHFASIAPSGALAEMLTYRYYALGGDDPLPYANTADPARDMADPVWHRAEELLQAALEEGDKYLLERSTALDPGLEALTPETLRRDEDRDGFFEEEYRFANGSFTGWILDGNEDGISERAVTAEGSMITVWYRRDRRVDAYTYLRYPRVGEILRITLSEDSEEAVEQILRWIPPEPFDLELPLIIQRGDGTTADLEASIREWGPLPTWFEARDRVIQTGYPTRSLDRQFRNAMVVGDETADRMRHLGLLR